MRKMRIEAAVFILFMAGLSCSGYLPTRYYAIDEKPPVVKASNAYPVALEVRALRAPSRYKDQMVYRTSKYQIGFNEFSQWVEPPGEMVMRALINGLNKAQLFQRVEPLGMIAVPDLILQGNVIRFDQVLGKKGKMADCEIELEIVPISGGRPIWKYAAKGMVEQEKAGADGFVPAMSAAVDEALSGAIAAMDGSAELREFISEMSAPTPTPVPPIDPTPAETPAETPSAV